MLKLRRSTALGLAIVLIFGSSMTVSASQESNTEETMYLIDSKTGEICEGLVKEETVISQIDNEYTVSKTVDIYIPNETSEISPCVIVTDGSVTARIELSVKYTQMGKKYKLTGVNGKFQLLDSTFTLSNRLVKFTCQSDVGKGHIWTVNPTSNSFSYSGCDHWIDTGNDMEWWLGAYASCTVSRGASSWELRATEDITKNCGVSW